MNAAICMARLCSTLQGPAHRQHSACFLWGLHFGGLSIPCQNSSAAQVTLCARCALQLLCLWHRVACCSFLCVSWQPGHIRRLDSPEGLLDLSDAFVRLPRTSSRLWHLPDSFTVCQCSASLTPCPSQSSDSFLPASASLMTVLDSPLTACLPASAVYSAAWRPHHHACTRGPVWLQQSRRQQPRPLPKAARQPSPQSEPAPPLPRLPPAGRPA